MIVIAAAVSITETELDLMQAAAGCKRVSAVVGDLITTDLGAVLL